MTCHNSERCKNGDICPYAKLDNYFRVGGACYIPITEMTNEDFIRQCSFEEMAGILYECYSEGHVEGKLGKNLSSITPIVGWLKEKHTNG